MVNLEDLKKEARNLLKDEKVKYIIGFAESSNGASAAPVFLKTPEDADKLVWNPGCVHNLTRFLRDEKKRKAREKHRDERPVGIVVKGCDSRAINVLLQEKYINRDDVFILGVSCENLGVIDEKKLANKLKGKISQHIEWDENRDLVATTENGSIKIPADEVLAERCMECPAQSPVVYDILFGDKIKRNINSDQQFKSVEQIETLTQKEKWDFWKEQFDKCIRCYACRSVCPMCYCDECVVDTITFAISADTTAEEKAQKIKWIEKSPVPSETFIYHMIRAIHLVGRCIDCGECERVCPLDIPIRFLNKKLEKEAKSHFDYEVGFDPDQLSLVSSFKDDDPEDFIR
ncbi:4Fe-4S dicluster domain-containing protein [Acidobacteriota bacterium]